MDRCEFRLMDTEGADVFQTSSVAGVVTVLKNWRCILFSSFVNKVSREIIVSVDLNRLDPTDQTGLDSRPDRGRPARGRLVGPRCAAHI